jgi:hypothetical protein
LNAMLTDVRNLLYWVWSGNGLRGGDPHMQIMTRSLNDSC